MADIFEYECELCHRLTPTTELVNGLCPECRFYHIPTFLRKPKTKYEPLKIIKGGKYEYDK